MKVFFLKLNKNQMLVFKKNYQTNKNFEVINLSYKYLIFLK